jgi:uncharacterized protein
MEGDISPQSIASGSRGITMKKRGGFFFGIITGILGALSSLHGAEFRFPILVGPARFLTLPAIQFNLLVSLVTTVVLCCIDRSGFLRAGILAAKWRIYVNVIPGSLVGAWLGALWISKRDELEARSWAVRALIFVGIFLIAYQWLIIQRIHFHAGFVRSMITVAGALLGGFLTSTIGTGSEAIYIVTLAIFHDFSNLMGETIASTAIVPTLLVSLGTFWSRRKLSLPTGTPGLVVTTATGSILGVLLVSRVFSLNAGWLIHGVFGLLLILAALQVQRVG